ncbi:MAG: AAA family ATPase [Patescibacteria group bacterium]
MKKAILVTGVTGSGKSVVSEYLNNLGYEAYDIEEIEGMFAMYRKDTKEVFEGYENTPEKIKNADWICDVGKLKELLNKQKSDLAFYCGVASNMDDIIPLFDKMILLKADSETIMKRLASREGTDKMGATEESREMVLDWKDWWESEIEKKGAIVIDANGSVEDVTRRILDIVNNQTN